MRQFRQFQREKEVMKRFDDVMQMGLPLGDTKTLMKAAKAMRQLPPSQPHSETSRAAAKAIEPIAGTLRAGVLEYLRDRLKDGATDEEMQLALGLSPHTQCPRRIELVRGGLVFDSGLKRPTQSGRKATVWKATIL